MSEMEEKSSEGLSSSRNALGDGSSSQSQSAPNSVGQSQDGNQAVVNPAEFVATLQSTFQSMQDRFTQMMDTVMERMDEMADRLNELEKEVTDLVNYAGGIADQPNKDTENIPPTGPGSE